MYSTSAPAATVGATCAKAKAVEAATVTATATTTATVTAVWRVWLPLWHLWGC
jgi:hypothetical protein